jgi:molybdate/tungstate transport system permease protein
MFRTRTRPGRDGIDWVTALTAAGALLVTFYVVPLLALVSSQSLGTLLTELGTPTVQRAATNSVLTAVVSTLLATLLGLPLAYWLARSDSRLTNLVGTVVLLPLVLPPIVSGMLLLRVVGPNALGGLLGLSLTRSHVGVILAQTFVASPFVVVTAKAAFGRVDPDLEDAARTLGMDRLATIRRVTLPLAAPGILAGVTLAFARAMGEFGATVMLAYYPRTMPVQIWVSYVSLGLEKAFPVALLLLLVSMTVLVVLTRLGSHPWE